MEYFNTLKQNAIEAEADNNKMIRLAQTNKNNISYLNTSIPGSSDSSDPLDVPLNMMIAADGTSLSSAVEYDKIKHKATATARRNEDMSIYDNNMNDYDQNYKNNDIKPSFHQGQETPSTKRMRY
ncbi:hypothetical protein DASB73_019420 [Starmerella bacillaris]|uniref:Uncharacterized protein n=1 Tax=Starmerella bacillaris TaxID=1247836 RepID=A0AAV5RHJ1_STABA|nr:hypothetical protein DASB73_019420 [Starmerella bacillaris]